MSKQPNKPIVKTVPEETVPDQRFIQNLSQFLDEVRKHIDDNELIWDSGPSSSSDWASYKDSINEMYCEVKRYLAHLIRARLNNIPIELPIQLLVMEEITELKKLMVGLKSTAFTHLSH